MKTCPIEAVLKAIGGKWKILILWNLLGETRRFGELRRRLPGISERMLIQGLRELERDGIVHREQYPEVPPRVEYSLTPKGRDLTPILNQLALWGVEHLDEPEPTAEAGALPAAAGLSKRG